MANSFKYSISIVVPCYNEEAILLHNLEVIRDYLESEVEGYDWEILIINDGSKDSTGKIANEFAIANERVRVIHHPTNLNLGRALQTGFLNANGDIIIVLDVDLSYSTEYIRKLADKLVETEADIVIASPYMKGGKVVAVPFKRKIMSRWVNRFMRFAAQDKYYTFTGMVRAYRRTYIRSVNLKTKDYEINPEILYKSMILRAKIVEIPATLDWTEQMKYTGKRTSSLRIIRSTFSSLMSAFIFRPYIYFWIVGIALLLLSFYQLGWLLFYTLHDMSNFGVDKNYPGGPFSQSLALQFKKNPQSFVVGGITFIIAIQFFSVGFLSLQNKRYFEELFHLGTFLRRQSKFEELGKSESRNRDQKMPEVERTI
jgi:glycosyltransferase involved in cell wall biosynthesis